jgi:predicted Co/Zn/Cd cation transporter (cation efflux family)
MRTLSSIEQEVNQIRLKIFEETKDLTPEQYRQRLEKITDAAVKKYGFKVVTSVDKLA